MRRRSVTGFLACLILFSIQPAAMAADVFVIHAGELLAVPGKPPLKQHTLIVEGEKILDVRSGFADPAEFDGDVDVIDLGDYFVMPGLMDMHVHLQYQMGPDNARESLKMSDALTGMRSAHYALKTLLAGFTTVRDVGSQAEQMYALRDAIEAGWIDGPRIVAAGVVGITGGHADASGMKPQYMDLASKESICDGPYDCRRATRRAIKYGADLIKIAATGGVMTDNDTGTNQHMADDELREVVRAAAAMGRKVAAHAHGTDGIDAALRAGVASIEHGSYAAASSIELFRETGAYLVPTLLAGDTVMGTMRGQDYLSSAIEEKARRIVGETQGNFTAAYRAGVRIAYGTDSGISPHGTNAREAVLMHEAGMGEMDILVSATVNAADLLGLSDSIGTLEPSKQADLIAMSESPLENIEELLDVDFVMKSGKIYVGRPVDLP